MKNVSVRVPLRVDLAGGTLDLWPLYLFHPGARTVNVAVSLYAECEISPRTDGAIELQLTDDGYSRIYASVADLSSDPRGALIAKAVEHFHATGIRVVTRTEAPRGSGLGGSSALAIALVRALSEYVGAPIEGEALIELVRDLETRLLGIPAGVQDYYPPVYGGLGSLHLDPGHVARHPLRFPLGELAESMIVHYTGISHFSGTNNWEIYKRHLDGDARVKDELSAIAAAANDLERGLEALDVAAAGRALAREWQHRRALIDGVATPQIDTAIILGVGAGAWGGKVCGAGGGGCIVFLAPKERRAAVIEALQRTGGRTLEIAPVAGGLVLDTPDISQRSFAFVRRPRLGSPDEQMQHLYLVSDREGLLRPYLLVEALITFDDARRSIHHEVERARIAPFVLHHGRIDWGAGRAVDSDRLALTAEPEKGRDLAVSPDDDALVAAIAELDDAFREFLLDTERLTIFENTAFEMVSEPGESSEAFLARCMERAQEKIEQGTTNLESTFRRRIDQIRERSEKDQRERDAQDEQDGVGSTASDVTIGWGQELYNITTGKGSSTRTAESPAEADYMEKIARVQKMWERELEELRDELTAQARSIEEVALAPSAKGIEIARAVVVWAPGVW